MDFGKLENISSVDFQLPPDNAFTQALWQNSVEPKSPSIYIGPPVWADTNWIGKIYPAKAKQSELLALYCKQFNTIELNVTHYQIPTEDTIEKWRESATERFLFCPKFPQIISHERQLVASENLTEQFCTSILGLNEHLGTTFLQLSPYFEPRQLKTLEKYLRLIPKEIATSVEFRNEKWFQDEALWRDTLAMLHNFGMGTVITDVAGRRDVLHQSLSNTTFMLRFVGNELHPSDYSRADTWIERLITWFDLGLEKAFLFIHCGTNRFAPELCRYWIEQLNKKGSFNLNSPYFYPTLVQTKLF